MALILSEIISALIQLVVFALIPFIVYLISNKSVKGFCNYIGAVKTTNKAILLSICTSLIFVFGTLGYVLTNEDVLLVMTTPPTVTGKLHQMGLSGTSIIVLIITACFKTSLAEEVLFRGFIAKRLMSKYGYLNGNIAQSLIFALIHLVLFSLLSKSGIGFLLYIFALSGIGAFIIGYIKEKHGNGSIFPGWIAHGLGNLVSYFIIAFVF